MYTPFVILCAATTVFASPLITTSDMVSLQLAHVLEQMEYAFYTQALKQFNDTDFLAAGFSSPQIPIQQIRMIANDENTHANALEFGIRKLGGQVISGCQFNFTSVLENAGTMITTARWMENVGLSAYLGTLPFNNLALDLFASEIATVEARHQTVFNVLDATSGIPQSFDVRLEAQDVVTLVKPFISGCDLGVSANPPLTVTTNGPVQVRTKLSFTSPALNGSIPTDQLSCKFVTGSLNASVYQSIDNCEVPANVNGLIYVFITHNDQVATNSPSNTNETTNSNATVAGPGLILVNKPDLIGNLVRPGSNATTGDETGNRTFATSAFTGFTSSVTGTTSVPSSTGSAPPTLTTSKPSLGGPTTPAQASASPSSI